jgi:hypothetical protein
MFAKIIFVCIFFLGLASARMNLAWPTDYYNTNSSNHTNTTNTTNQTNLTYQTVQAQLWGWWNRNSHLLSSNFAWNSFFLNDGNFYSYYELEWAFTNFFNWMYANGCPDFWFGEVFALNNTGWVSWELNCSSIFAKGSITYEVKDGVIQHASFDKYINNISNSSNSSNSSNATWDVATRQFNSWARSDEWGILEDYDDNLFAIINSENGTQTFQGRWSVEWYIRSVLDEIQICGNSYWQLPVVGNNVIYIKWWRECNDVIKSGSDTLIVNDSGMVSNLVITSNIIERSR